MDNRRLVLVGQQSAAQELSRMCMHECLHWCVERGSEGGLVPHTPAHGHVSYPRKGDSPVLFIHRLPPCVPLTRFSVHFSVEEHTLPGPNGQHQQLLVTPRLNCSVPTEVLSLICKAKIKLQPYHKQYLASTLHIPFSYHVVSGKSVHQNPFN